MKLAYISRSFIPSRSANSVHVMKMCEAFVRNGHQVVLLAPDSKDVEPGEHDPYRFYGVEPCFPIEKLPWLRFKGKGDVYGFLAARRARGLKVDLVYSRVLSGCFFSTLLGQPVIYESHEPVAAAGGSVAWMFERVVRRPSFRRLVVISEALRKLYTESHGALLADRIAVAHDAADPPRRDADEEIIETGKFQVGYIGHLFAGRGIGLILQLAEQCPWADFHLIGGTESDLAYWRKGGTSRSNIYFRGFVAPAALERERRSFDVLLAPYQRRVSVYGGTGNTSQWMSPLKIFEYMAAGKAILCSNLPVLREVLSHEETALLCDPEDVRSWVEALERLRNDSALRNELGKRAADRVEQCHTWSSRAKKVLAGVLC